MSRGGAGAFGMASKRAINSGRNVQALKVKAPATPIAPISAAANMGPQSLAILNCTEFSARAGLSSERGTRLGTTERKTGPLRAHTIPSRNVKTITTQGVAPYALTCLEKCLLRLQEKIFLRLAPARWFSQANGDSFPVLEHLFEGKPRSYGLDYLAKGKAKFPPAASVPRLPASGIPRGKVRAPGPEPCRSTTPQTACRRARLWRSPGPAWADGRVGLSA